MGLKSHEPICCKFVLDPDGVSSANYGRNGFVESAPDDVEDTLGDLGDERPHDGAVTEVEDVEAASGGRVDAVPAVFGAVAAPLWDGSTIVRKNFRFNITIIIIIMITVQ
jgi:hypothetical protein